MLNAYVVLYCQDMLPMSTLEDLSFSLLKGSLACNLLAILVQQMTKFALFFP